MSKIILIAIIMVVVGGVGALFQYSPFRAQPPKTIHIGVIRTPPALDPAWEGFREKMKTFGYVEGKNVNYAVIEAGKDLPETKIKAAKLLGAKIDLIYTMGVLPTRAAKEVTAEMNPNLPIIFGVVSDPVGGKLVAALSGSGNNLTGVTPANDLISPKRLEFLKSMLPGMRRAIIAWNDPNTTGIEDLRKVAKILGVILTEKEVKVPDDIDKFLDSFIFRPGDVIFRATDNVNAARSQKMLKFSLDRKIPLSGTNAFDAESGALMSYGANYRRVGEQAARLAHRVLEGARPGDLPVELPEEFELIVNLKTAEKIGVEISSEFLAKANRIIN